jgi:hypothetical protein
MKKGIILFFSSNNTIWANETLNKHNIQNKLQSVPIEISTDCGYCISITVEDIPMGKEILKSNNIEYDKIVIL